MKSITLILTVLLVMTFGFRTLGTIYQSQVLDCAEYASDYMETYRLVPEVIPIASDTCNFATALEMFTKSILLLDQGLYVQFEEISVINPPVNLYPDISISEELFQNSFLRSEYVEFCQSILDILITNNTIPDLFEFNNGHIRIPETFYLLSSILRFYAFYGIMPESKELLIISSKGLVPWDTPDGFEHFSSVNNNWHKTYRRYNPFSVGQYDMFKTAKDIAGTLTNYFDVAQQLYYSMNSYGEYVIYKRSFGQNMSTSEQQRHKLTNSAFPLRNMTGWAKSIGIPTRGSMFYDKDSEDWLNIEIHCPFGSDPNTCNYTKWTGDSLGPPKKEDKLIEKIKNIMNYSGSSVEGFKSFWVNPGDVEEFGPDFLIDQAISGGFNSIILTVKTELGHLYYSTSLFPDQFEFDALGQLINANQGNNIQIFAGFSVLADKYTLDQNFNNYRQILVSNPIENYPNMSISPCICEYRENINLMLEEISGINGLSGIILSHLYWDTISYATEMGGNPSCDQFNTGDGWQENLIESYGIELIETIKSINSNLGVLITSFPVSWSCYSSFDGHEDKLKMAEIADGLIVPYDGNFWLSDFEDWHNFCNGTWDPQWPVPFDLESYIFQLSSETETPIILSQNLTEEWVFPAKFYSGLFSYVQTYGADGLNIHSPVSLLGEYGPAFRKIQLRKIGSIDFDMPYITGEFSESSNIQTQQLKVIAYPNPFSNELNFEIDVKKTTQIVIRIFNLYGKEIELLVEEKVDQGKHIYKWFPANLKPSMFIYRINIGNSEKSGKIILSNN
ncbi:MAG TPA: T9SS type A sorting domain-containing protein [Bacteroidales bacterium]|nr:T9SS type A sorting domain-containing protein [Bacteroidales bacterium]HRX98146.1 T9SS type A sorting domain-containing protein [Bacteroidales bacterium]